MGNHNRRWYQQIYLSPTWVCTICEFDLGVYGNPQALHSHLQEFHHDDYTSEQLRIISQQSKIKQPRAWDDCLLCCFKVEKENDNGTTGFLKRTNGISKHDAVKSARTTYLMMHPGHYSSDESDISDTSPDLDMISLQQRLQKTEGRSKAIARHIAVHLQVLMLLTLRFAALQKDDKNLVDDDLKSDCVDIDDENSSSKSSDPEKLSGIDSKRDVAMEDMSDEADSGVAKNMDNDLLEDGIPVPDTDLDFSGIPRQYDGLVAENDAFLKNVIESGAWQSWQDETKEPIRHNCESYTIGWICATRTEYTAARAFFDNVHEWPDYIPEDDEMLYTCTFGQIRRHNIIIATSLNGRYKQSSVADVARDIRHRFHNIRFCLLVGIGGGAPSTKHDIRLGDVIVGYSSSARIGSAIQYDNIQNEKYTLIGVLNQPPAVLRAAINRLMSRYDTEGHMLKEAINTASDKNQRLRERYKRPETDRLYRSQFVHPSDSETDCAVVCGDDTSSFIQRPERAEDGPTIHYGLIASANSPMKDALLRDTLTEQEDILCFETEAAGLVESFPCVVIRGICDYSDSHHNESWQGYAAMSAAAYAKDLLCQIPPTVVDPQTSKTQQTAGFIREPSETVRSALESPFLPGSDWECVPHWERPKTIYVQWDEDKAGSKATGSQTT